MLTLSAPAKINLSLEVLARREDGYHEIASVLQTIDLADTLSFEPAERLSFECLDPGAVRADLLEEVLLQAARLLQQETGCGKGAAIRVDNVRIPRAAGLGSSSSDSAAILRGLSELWSLGLSGDRLCQLASNLGSDTPFFIFGGTALAEGRGERISPLPAPPTTWLVLLSPPIVPVPGKTARMYGMLSTSDFTSGGFTRELASCLQAGNADTGMMYNAFGRPAFDFFEGLADYRRRFISAGAERVHLAGSGPALFTIVPDEAGGQALANRLKDEGLDALVTRTVSSNTA